MAPSVPPKSQGESKNQSDAESTQSLTPSPRGSLRQRRKQGSQVSTIASSGGIKSRPKFVVPKKTVVKKPNCKMEVSLTRALLAASTNSADGQNSGLSPLEQMKRYVAQADEHIEDMIERLVSNVHSSAESAAQRSSAMVHDASEKATEIVHSAMQKIKDWKACHFDMLPSWMRDNDYLHFGHRPQLGSFAECFRSIFRIHTETGNIWTHLIGFIMFIIATIVFYIKPFCDNCHQDIHVSDKLIFLFFFIGAMLCLLCSTLFHTVSCHSPDVSSLFSRLDYCGIAILIVGSVIPWLYYGFYCQFYTKLTYMIVVGVLGIATMVVVMWEKFNQPAYRSMRAAVFVSLGCLSALPAIHFIVQYGLKESMNQASLHYMLIMGALYLTGALLYATRVPERFLPGKCDIWFQSHQIFHLLVVVAAFVHYHGITEMALHRLHSGVNCPTSPTSNVY